MTLGPSLHHSDSFQSPIFTLAPPSGRDPGNRATSSKLCSG